MARLSFTIAGLTGSTRVAPEFDEPKAKKGWPFGGCVLPGYPALSS